MVKRKKALKLGNDSQYENQSQRKKSARHMVKHLLLGFIFLSWFLAGISMALACIAITPAQFLFAYCLTILLIFSPITLLKKLANRGVLNE